MIVDSHAHVILPPSRQIAQMDEAGIHQTLLFATTPHPETAPDLPALEREFARLNRLLSGTVSLEERLKNMDRILSELKASVSMHPDRFAGFAPVPLAMTPEDTAQWIADRVVRQGFIGMGEFTPAPGSAGLLRPVFQASAQFGGLPLWIHAFYPLTQPDIREITVMAADHPSVPVVIGHLGGVHWLDALRLAEANKNIYLDLSAAFSHLAAGTVIKALPERSLFASDAPYGDPLLARQMVERLCPDRHVCGMVLGENALRMIGR